MRYYVISGETSGDNHAARVITELKELDSNTEFRGMGGDRSEAAGQQLLLHQKEMAIIGFFEVVRNLREIAKNLKLVKKDIATWNPECIILVDYPGFNFKIAKYAAELNIPVHYYIAPKVWAWKESRVKLIKRYVTKLYCILPFEPEYFQKHNIQVDYVGNPSKETVDEYLANNATPETKKSIALLPGSRSSEINAALPIMLEALSDFSEYEIKIAQAPGFSDAFYHDFDPRLTLVKDDMYGLLADSKASIVTSGTATLETALMNVPQVICYKTSYISYLIVKAVVKLKYVSLVNLILNREAINELLQYEFTAENIKKQLTALLEDSKERKELLLDYDILRQNLGDKKPSKLVAKGIFNSLRA